MKRTYSIVAVGVILFIGYLLWDFDFSADEDFEVRYLGDAREIFIPNHPQSSIPPDVVFFVRTANNLMAISSDLSLQKGTDLRGRQETCTIFVTNLSNGERLQFGSREDLAERYGRSNRGVTEIIQEYNRQQC